MHAHTHTHTHARTHTPCVTHTTCKLVHEGTNAASCRARATAVAARLLGLDAHLILRTSRALVDKDPGAVGNLLVDRLCGAALHLVSRETYGRVGSATLLATLGAQLRAGYDRAALAAPLEHGCVYPGIDVALATLAMRTPLAVVTNKPTHLARAVLAAANLAHHFRSVHGADHHALRKPAPAMLQAAATQLGVTTTHMAMVGDSAADLGAATRAGCAAVFVDWGYGRPELPPDDRWRDPAPRFARVTSADALLKTLLEP
jgi:phosphoglycolate phosphatase